MQQHFSTQIRDEFSSCITRTIGRLDSEPTSRPFHERLLSTTALFWSRFERSFSTSFGQSAVEKISFIVAQASGATNIIRQKETWLELPTSIVEAINSHVRELREGSCTPNWQDDMSAITNTVREGAIIRQRVISDLAFDRNGRTHYFSIKTVKPNLDQTAEAKKDLMLLKASNPQSAVFFGLYYNPYGENREDYTHIFPMKIFNMHHDETVLIGRDYWDRIGGIGTYEGLLELAAEAGEITRQAVQTYGIDN